MIAEVINYKSLIDARNFYERNGYIYIESPWVVPADVMNITRPSDVAAIKKESFVASGEQSLLQMILKSKLPEGLWQTITPCYRPQDGVNDDDLHFSQFYKLELMWYKGNVEPSHELVSIVSGMVLDYLANYDLECRVSSVSDVERAGCETINPVDIEVKVNGKWIEFGSYGIRFSEKIGYWVFGTGLPEPRFSYLVNRSK